MPRVERTYAEDGTEGEQWRQGLIRLLSQGLFQYLKKEGLLCHDEARRANISKLLQETDCQGSNDDNGEGGLDSSADLSVNGAEPKEEAPP